MSSALQNLSAEIFDSIIRYCDDKSSLVALVRTCKPLHRLMLPYLYRDISLTYSYDIQGTERLRPLALTLLQKPEIAALVHSFAIRPIYTAEHIVKGPEDRPEWITWQQYPDLDQILRRAIKEQLARDLHVPEPALTRSKAKRARKHIQGTDSAEEWLVHARAGHDEASILALLLPKLANLHTLDLPFSREYLDVPEVRGESRYTHYIAEMLHRARARGSDPDSISAFGHLTDVMIPSVDDKYPDNPDYLALCVTLPTIKRLYGSNQGNVDDISDKDQPDEAFNELVPGSSTIEFIHLRHSKLRSANFLSLMHSPKCLKTLIYEIGNTWAWTPVEFSKLQTALEAQKTSLERLCLSHAQFTPFQDEIDELTSMTFQEFSILKHFRVASIYLYGNECLKYGLGCADRVSDAPEVTAEDIASTRNLFVDVLPNKLETLDLLYCHDATTLQRVLLGVEEILVHKHEKFPSLREVSIHGENDKNLKEMLTSFKSLPWKTTGVRFVMRCQPNGNSEQVAWGWDEEVEWAEVFHSFYGAVEILYDSRNEC